jgi:FtsZ-binding cell division protein ZapB
VREIGSRRESLGECFKNEVMHMHLESFDQLEERVNKAVKLVGKLREENKELAATNQELQAKIQEYQNAYKKLQEEHQRLKQEEKKSKQTQDKQMEITTKVQQMLQKLDIIDTGI